MGDSAGGNMAVVLTMMAAEEALPLPSRHVLISPGLDMSLANPEVFEAPSVDPWLAFPAGWRRSGSTAPASTAATGTSARFTATFRCCRRRCF